MNGLTLYGTDNTFRIFSGTQNSHTKFLNHSEATFNEELFNNFSHLDDYDYTPSSQVKGCEATHKPTSESDPSVEDRNLEESRPVAVQPKTSTENSTHVQKAIICRKLLGISELSYFEGKKGDSLYHLQDIRITVQKIFALPKAVGSNYHTDDTIICGDDKEMAKSSVRILTQ